MTQRLNLARHPFLNTRPIWLVGGVLALLAVVLTAISLSEFLIARGNERASAERLAGLEARSRRLRSEVEDTSRKLNAVGWKKLGAEAATLQQVVVQRKFAWTRMLSDLERLLPWDVRLDSVAPGTEKDAIVISLTGVAATREAWLKLLARCFEDEHFSDPVPGSEQAPGQSNAEGYVFSLRVRYWPEGRR